MHKQISREELERLKHEARVAYVRDIEAAGADSGKMDLAAKKLSWAEQAARDAFSQRSGFYRFFDSIPLIGRPATFVLDNIEKGTAEHGRFWGLIIGLLLGLIMAVMLIVLTEGASFVFEIGRSWINLRWTQPILTQQKNAVEKLGTRDYAEHLIHLEQRVEAVKTPLIYYAVDKSRDTNIVNGNELPYELLEFLGRHEREALTSTALETLSYESQITPFFFHNESRDAATVHPPGKGTCVIASLDGRIIFVPLDAYKAAGLPLHESAPNPATATEHGAR